MAAYTELVIDQGATFTANVNITSDTDGSGFDLTGFTASSQMRKSYYSSTAYDFTVSASNSANGEVLIQMSSANTANLSPGRYVYDLLISDGNSKTRVIEGIVTVLPSVTR